VTDSPFKLADDRWLEISKVSGLPEEARHLVEQVAGYYGRFVTVSSRAETLEQLQAMKRHGEELQHLVRTRPVAMFNAYVAANNGDGLAILRSDGAFQECEKMLSGLSAWTDRAIAGLAPGGRAPKTDPANLDWLICELDKILALFTSARITRSEKDRTAEYVELVVTAIPDHKATGIREAIKRQAAKTRQN
jgi:hypothetical protein